VTGESTPAKGAPWVTKRDRAEPIGSESHYGMLGPKASRALRKGETFGSDPSRSAALRSALVGMVNAGWSFEGITGAVFDRTNAGGRKVQDLADQRSIARAMKYLRREHAQALEYVRKNALVLDRNGALLAITEWREAVESAVWRGQGAITDRNTLHASGRIAHATGSATRFPLSARRLADEIGVSATTAARSLKRVVKAGWLRPVLRSDGANPAVYALTIPRGCEVGGTSPHTGIAREVSHLLHSFGPSHDAWRRRALGKGPQRVYELLLRNLTAAAEIASHLGITKRAVYQHLERLRDAELVENNNARWHCTDRTLAEVAAEFGTEGQGEKQRERHAEQRDAYHGVSRHDQRQTPSELNPQGGQR